MSLVIHMDLVGKYQVKPFSKNRKNIVLILREGWRRHSVHGAIEIDVTNGMKLIKDYKQKTGRDVSFTGWIIKCIAHALSEHKELNALRHGRNKIIIFDDVDVAIPVERSTGSEIRPMVYILRRANEKNVLEITEEIRDVQTKKVGDSTQLLSKKLSRLERFALNSPFIIKKFLLWFSRQNAILKKKHMGTIGVTSIGMKGRFPGWLVPLGGTTTFLFALSSITKKPGVVDDKILIREYLSLTVSVDHDIVDGSPLARFIDRLVELIETGFGLTDI